jgi:hypothetical protein
MARTIHRLGLVVLASLSLAATAEAAPPPNDNYLSSFLMADGDRLAREFRDAQNTTEATTQPDLFNPNRDGQPFGGGGPENTQCGATSFGRTVWYDLLPEVAGGVQIVASGFDTVVAVYEYDLETASITRNVVCQNDSAGTAEDVILPEVRGGRAYTVQVGGVGGAGGPLDFNFTFFPDTDADGVLDDAPDRCLRLRGVPGFGGCPPELRATPRLTWDRTANGVRFTKLDIEGVPRGARVQARCRRCGVSQSQRARRKTVSLRRFVGREAPAGAVLELRVTMKRRGSGRFRHGAFGNYFRYEFGRGEVRSRTVRCLLPGKRAPRRRCP